MLKTLFTTTLLLLVFLSVPSAVLAETTDYVPVIPLQWEIPTTTAVGSPLAATAIKGFELEHKIDDGRWVNGSPTGNLIARNVTMFDYQLNTVGEHCFRIRTLDNADRKANWSNEYCETVTSPPAVIRIFRKVQP